MTDLRSDQQTTLDAARREAHTWVLVATDGSPAALEAAATAGETFGDAEIVVLAVVDGRSVPDQSSAHDAVERTCARLATDEPRRIVRSGRPVAVVTELVHTLAIDVVAVGAPRGRFRFRPSVPDSLLRRLDCDVLVIGDQGRAPTPHG